MKINKFAILLICSTLTSLTYAKNLDKTVTAKNISLVEWDSPEGIHRLEVSKSKVDFFKLANQFESQRNKLYCAVTSTVIVLNALRVKVQGAVLPYDKTSILPKDTKYFSKTFDPFFERYTQENIFSKSPKTKAEVLGKPFIKDKKEIQSFGYQLHQLVDLLKAYNLNVVMKIVDNKLDNSTIKSDLILNLKTKDDYVLINYHRKLLGQVGAGHVSPLGAYDEESDSFLIMDVNPNNANWVWVKSTDLINAMRTVDVSDNRGYVLVSEQKTK